MIKESLKNELDKQKAEADISASNAVKQVKLLMDADSTEDLRILRNLAPQSNQMRIEKAVGKQLEIQKLEDEFDGDIYTIDQIRNLAQRYNMRFLPSTKFNGSIDVEVLAKIKAFAKKTNTEINEWTLKKRFFILAPQEEFALDETIHTTVEYHDPVMFYQIDETHYKFLHKWGSDFTVFRLIEGFRWRNIWTYRLTQTIYNLPLMAIVVCLLGWLIGVDSLVNWGTYFFTVAFSILFAFFSSFKYRDSDWDQIKGYFNQWNWNSDKQIVGKRHIIKNRFERDDD